MIHRCSKGSEIRPALQIDYEDDYTTHLHGSKLLKPGGAVVSERRALEAVLPESILLIRAHRCVRGRLKNRKKKERGGTARKDTERHGKVRLGKEW